MKTKFGRNDILPYTSKEWTKRYMAYPNLSLDKSVVPRYVITRSTKIFIAAAVFLAGILISSIVDQDDEDYNYYQENKNKAPKKATSSNIFSEFLNGTFLLCNIFLAKITLGMDQVKQTFATLFNLNPPVETIDLKEWHVCELDEREYLGASYTRYRFNLANEDVVLPLYVGQEVLSFHFLVLNSFKTNISIACSVFDRCQGGGQGSQGDFLSHISAHCQGLLRHPRLFLRDQLLLSHGQDAAGT